MLKYNYIFFNVADINTRISTPLEYNAICVKDLLSMQGVKVVSYPVDYASYLIRWFYSIHHSSRINKIVKIPFKKLWYPFYFKENFTDNKPICFVLSCTYLSIDYLKYLKKKYPNCRIVRIHRDLIGLWKQKHSDFEEESKLIDLRLSYDCEDSKKYGIPHFDEFESKINIERAPNYPLSDVFFAGKAKDRLPMILDVYHKLAEAGLNCDFFITNVQKNMQIHLKGITYSDKPMSYYQMLYRSVNSKCILEIQQTGATGYTSRFLEAVMYNKKLITNNQSIKDSPFYHKDYIQCFTNLDDIDTSFVTKSLENIDYHYNNEFSPIHLIEQIDSELERIDSCENR